MSPPLAELLKIIKNTDAWRSLSEALEFSPVAGVKAVGGLRPALAAAISSSAKGPVVVVNKTIAGAEQFAEEAADYLPGERIAVLPDWESYPFESVRPDVEAIGRRAEIFEKLAGDKPLLITVAVSTLLQKVPGPNERAFRALILVAGDEIRVHDLLGNLVELGYVRSQVVERAGEFAARGSVVDIFPAQGSAPVRVDFFGDEIESLKAFDIVSQRSIKSMDAVKIRPSREFRLDDTAVERVLSAGGRPREDEGVHRWLPVIYKLAAIKSYFPSHTVWLVDEPKAVKDEAARFYEEQARTLSEGYSGEIPFGVSDYYIEPDSLWSDLVPRVELASALIGPDTIETKAQLPPAVAGDITRLENTLSEHKKSHYKSVLVLKDRGEVDRLGELFSDFGLEFAGGRAGEAALSLIEGRANSGYMLPEAGLAVFGQADIFPRQRIESEATFRARRQSLIDFSDLTHGELLVHETHGIARFSGLTKQSVGGKTREYLMLDYAAGDRLYVPTEQLDRVSRYVAPEGVQAEITRLGGADWQRATKKARRSIKKLAVDLMALYAERIDSRGYSFSTDTDWQRGLEAAFPYQATRDQAVAINEVKKDMEAPKPMDRLVCGDVGYGKTEVALRAAFKAIMDGKQVLMLVPTTILAQQHYLTFKERFSPYPVKVEMLSRFLSAAEQKQVVKRARAGETDMVIGTHRLLQKDVRWHDLGLVIIDEEQRFGVNAKEKLRELRKVVDVLTLSATPIPRTLQMSLSGIRDLSLIETPPEGRHPIITYIGEFQPATIRGAVRRELARGGQVFYVHNRVETIDRTADRLQEIVPEARVIVGHGKMTESQLEKVMIRFLGRECDVLVCTTIIESGIDIPSANTLIIEDADRLGLAQLYQLRGRVGRGRHRGYAYFTYRPGKSLTDPAVERLKAIGEFTELGSGYRVALRDLEIRGAGNVVGAEQHGFMISIGFDLFCRMLRREIDELQGKPAVEVSDVKIELPINAYIPAGYVGDENLRLEIYRSIAESRSVAEIDEVGSAIADRFGVPPAPVVNLLAVANLRLSARDAGIVSINLHKGRLVIKGEPQKLQKLSGRSDAKLKPSKGEAVIRVSPDQPDIVEFIIEILNE
jgi:transcription-repair coupling factor (superfamily II helicase)